MSDNNDHQSEEKVKPLSRLEFCLYLTVMAIYVTVSLYGYYLVVRWLGFTFEDAVVSIAMVFGVIVTISVIPSIHIR